MTIESPETWHEEETRKGRAAGPSWTLRRLTTDMALIAVAVGAGLQMLVTELRIPGRSCGDTPENNAIVLGLIVLFLTNVGEPLMALNDLGNRALERLTGPGPSRESNS